MSKYVQHCEHWGWRPMSIRFVDWGLSNDLHNAMHLKCSGCGTTWLVVLDPEDVMAIFGVGHLPRPEYTK